MKYIESAARNIANVAKENKIVVEKSTVPVKAAERFRFSIVLIAIGSIIIFYSSSCLCILYTVYVHAAQIVLINTN